MNLVLLGQKDRILIIVALAPGIVISHRAKVYVCVVSHGIALVQSTVSITITGDGNATGVGRLGYVVCHYRCGLHPAFIVRCTNRLGHAVRQNPGTERIRTAPRRIDPLHPVYRRGSGETRRDPALVHVLEVGAQTPQHRLCASNVDRVGSIRKTKKEDAGRNGVRTATAMKRMFEEVF